ncbi:glycerophosphodiester phosphodiesterase [Lacisediminihabitans changchengi]|nr:glycerophosphodiester phosphodiesterase [Lacisediminihabitans changchengi]
MDDVRPDDGRPSAATTYFTPAPPRVLAHRGLQLDAPENTMLAFEQAIALGVTHLETDVHASKDGVAVIVHDADLKRTAKRSVRVEQLTLAELREIDLGKGQTISTLAELLAAFPTARFNIDIKSMAAAEPASHDIIAAGAVARVLITSFNDKRRRAATDRMPGIATSASAPAFVTALIAARLAIAPLARWLMRNVDAVQIPERIAGFRTVTARTVRTFHSAGLEIHVWTVNDAPSMRKLYGRGVDGIFTDRADIALAVLRESFPHSR